MNDHSTEISVPARDDELPALTSAIRRMAGGFGLPSEKILRLQLIVEELFINTIVHGHLGNCDQPVRIALSGNAERLRLRYIDSAPAFDPTLATGAPGDPGELGGQGLHLVRSMSSALSYRRTQEENVIDLEVQ